MGKSVQLAFSEDRRHKHAVGKAHGERISGMRSLHKGEHFCRVGDRVSGINTVRAGILKCYRILDDGEEQVLGFYLTGDTFGFDAIATGLASCNIVALNSTSVLQTPLEALLENADADLQRNLVDNMSREILRLSGMLRMERCSAEQRVAIFLLDQSEYEAGRGCSPEEFMLPMSRRDLARYLHLATETVSRAFSRLQSIGLLSVERSRIRLHDIDGLRAFTSKDLDITFQPSHLLASRMLA